jgi:hypothetical protein
LLNAPDTVIIMVWVSNFSNSPIKVIISGGNGVTYTVDPYITGGATGIKVKTETWQDNHWNRSGAETLKFTIGTTTKSFEVKPEDHVTFYADTYVVSTAKTTYFL